MKEMSLNQIARACQGTYVGSEEQKSREVTGIDIDSRENLIACRYSVEEIRALIGADSLGFLSLEALHQIAPDAACGFCDGCFTGTYPIRPACGGGALSEGCGA